jgi:myo-inositol-1(or 4)-monophosphatase
MSEETEFVGDSEGWMWVVDPLDGTRNYVSGIPLFCVNIALCYAGEPLLGLTYEPLRREEFAAQRGRGAFLNGRPMHASAKDDVQSSVVTFDLGYDETRGGYMLVLMRAIWPGAQAFRIHGSGALGFAYAACARYDLFVHHKLYPWDIAAGIVLVQEAGGTVTDRDGSPATIYSEGALVGGPKVHADFLRIAEGRPWRE